MTMEQQTALKNEEMQNRWKSCISETCRTFRTNTWLKDSIDKLFEELRELLNSLKRTFNEVALKLSEAFKDLNNLIGNFDKEKYSKSYPQSYSHYVYNFKVNTKGFPHPIKTCARSRC